MRKPGAANVKPCFARTGNNFRPLLSIVDWIKARIERQPSIVFPPVRADERGPAGPPPGQLRAQGQVPEARSALAEALSAHPDDADLNYRMGLTFLESGDAEQALDHFNLALHYQASHFPACSARIRALDALGRSAESHGAIRQFLDANPGHVEGSLVLAGMYYRAGNHDAVLQTLEPLARGTVVDHQVANWMGLVLGREFGEFERANLYLRRVLEAEPNWLPALINLGWNLLEQGHYEEGYAHIDRALAIAPEDVEARMVRTCMKLKQGDFEEGWRDYAIRHSSKLASPCPYHFPPWRGESLEGKTLLVYGEQGIGDQIMFASCFNELIGQAGRTVIDCNPKLLALFRRSFARAEIHPSAPQGKEPDWLAGVGKIDFQIAMGDLPRLYRNHWGSFPDHHGYLVADPEKIRQWKSKLVSLDERFKLGVSWRGGMISTRKHLRSLPIEQLTPVLKLPLTAVSLQYGSVESDLAQLHTAHETELHHWQEAIDDYDQTAALVCALDGVLSVCTAIVHLSGALGRPTWVLVPAVSEWRYLDSGERMPWYPSARMIRQKVIGDWDETVYAVSKMLSAEIEERCP
jgi:tetratricopeptide (TPR) repeat protein